MRKMSDEAGEPLDEEMNEVIDRLDAGESPESIEESMPQPPDGDEGGMPGLGGL